MIALVMMVITLHNVYRVKMTKESAVYEPKLSRYVFTAGFFLFFYLQPGLLQNAFSQIQCTYIADGYYLQSDI